MNGTEKQIEMRKNTDDVRALLLGKNKKASVITFGCQQNEADSEKIRAMAIMMGYELTEDAEGADLVVINTCAIREHAELKALSVVGKFKAAKQARPDMILAVVGCMAAEAHRAEKIKKSYYYVDFTLEPSAIHRFPELIYKTLTTKKRSFLYGSEDFSVVEGVRPQRVSKHKAWVSVMYGCNNFCSYCIVPYVRGRERSRDSREVIEECKRLISSGYREITLLGQNVNSYKSDIDFATLLETVANIPGDFILRFMTSHPKDASDRLIEVVGKYPDKIAPAFHLPLQSGSDSVLRRMNRTYNMERYLSIVEKLRAVSPDISITSDIIVGFPGESEEDFSATLEALQKIEFDMVYSFIYSPREGTKAAAMEDQIPEDVKVERMTRLLDMQGNISKKKNMPYLDKSVRVLVDSYTDKDGERIYNARCPKNKLVHFKYTGEAEDVIGKFIYVKITRIGAFDLFGEVIGENKND
jgi:tRNA-2-methylthio-N6-dimethylallyladenosine synthase